MPDHDFYILTTSKSGHHQVSDPYTKDEALYLLGETKPADPNAKITKDRVEANAWDKSCTLCHESFEVR